MIINFQLAVFYQQSLTCEVIDKLYGQFQQFLSGSAAKL